MLNFIRRLHPIASGLLLLLIFLTAAPAFGDDYAEIRRIAHMAREKFDFDKHHFIGVGRSPTSLLAFLRAIAGDSIASTIPLSAMKEFEDPGKITEARAAWLKIHFRHFLPKPAEFAGKDLVIVDFAGSGLGLLHSLLQIQKFYAEEYGIDSSRIKGLGLTDYASGRTRLKNAGIAYIQIEDSDYADHLRDRFYAGNSEFDAVEVPEVPGPYTPPPRHTERFNKLRDEYKARLALPNEGCEPDLSTE